MALKSVVKVSHLSNLSDARYCAGMGVEMLGFSALPSARHYLTPQVFQDIRGWVAGPQIVAEIYGVMSTAEIQTVMRDYAPDYVELSIDEYELFAPVLTKPCIVSVADLSRIQCQEKKTGIAYVIIEDGTSCDDIASIPYPAWAKVSSVSRVLKLLGEKCFKGFVLEGPKETRPGYTNYDALGDILEALEEDA